MKKIILVLCLAVSGMRATQPQESKPTTQLCQNFSNMQIVAHLSLLIAIHAKCHQNNNDLGPDECLCIGHRIDDIRTNYTPQIHDGIAEFASIGITARPTLQSITEMFAAINNNNKNKEE